MKHRLLHEFTRDEIKLAFEQADSQQNGHLRVDELKNAIGYLNLHLPNRRIVESKRLLHYISSLRLTFSCE